MDMEKYPSLVEGTGLENREVGDGAGVRIPLSPPLYYIAEWSSLVARRAHNPKVVGSNPSSATIIFGPVVQRLSRLPVTQKIAGSNPVGTAILFLASQLSRQSRGLKILVSAVRFCPKPPFFYIRLRKNTRSQLSWIECLATNQKVRGSNPFERTMIREIAQFGSALGLGPRGCRFKSCFPDQLTY